jgi:hypothetical protein
MPLTGIRFQVDISDSHGNEYENASGDGGSTHVWNVGVLQRDYAVLYPKTLSSSDFYDVLVDSTTSDLGGPGFESRPWDRSAWQIFRGLPWSLQANADIVSKVQLPFTSFPIIIHTVILRYLNYTAEKVIKLFEI